jgi:hypothetical protein
MTWLPISLKNAAKCDKWYQLQNHSITESLNANGAREKPSTGQPRACRISQCRTTNLPPPARIFCALVWREKRTCVKRVWRSGREEPLSFERESFCGPRRRLVPHAARIPRSPPQGGAGCARVRAVVQKQHREKWKKHRVSERARRSRLVFSPSSFSSRFSHNPHQRRRRTLSPSKREKKAALFLHTQT